MILIISDRADLHTYRVTYYLRKWNIPYAHFDVVDYPSRASINFTIDGHIQNCDIVLPENIHINSSKIGAVWYRKPDNPNLTHLDESVKGYAFDECKKTLSGLYLYLNHCFWISPLQNLQNASNKPFQLNLVSNLGFTVPDTIVTNNPDDVWNFYKDNNGNIIYKTLSTGIISSKRNEWEYPEVHFEIYTTPINVTTKEDFNSVKNCPCLFQSYIPKKFELRITVVDHKVFAAEIHSQENPATMHDWRRDELDDITHKIHELPPEVSEMCVSLVDKLGLNFGAIDMIYTPNNEYVFLEINPNGNFAWIEDRTGLRISKAIAKSLVKGMNNTIKTNILSEIE
jgi:glutathione synthase/RimK-type ligase-like ATP-grasp enzyme